MQAIFEVSLFVVANCYGKMDDGPRVTHDNLNIRRKFETSYSYSIVCLTSSRKVAN